MAYRLVVRPLARARRFNQRLSRRTNNSDMVPGQVWRCHSIEKSILFSGMRSASKTYIISSTTMRIQASYGIGLWYPLRVGNPIASIPIRNRIPIATGDDDEIHPNFTMACISAALGECVMWGYQVYNQSYQRLTAEQSKYRDLGVSHQSCQRMVRADYCGNGMLHRQWNADRRVRYVWHPDAGQHPWQHAPKPMASRWCTLHPAHPLGTADSATTAGSPTFSACQTYRLAVWRSTKPSCNNDSGVVVLQEQQL